MAPSQPDVPVYSTVESRRFGLRVFRWEPPELDVDALLAFALGESADIIILRLPAVRQCELSRLDQAGLPYLAADTLVTYTCGLSGCLPSPPQNSALRFIPCGPDQEPDLCRMIETLFDHYPNHYLSNPLLPQDMVLEGYKEWVLAFASPGQGECFLVADGQKPVAFAAWAREKDGTCRAVLNGVLPEARRHGIYTDIIRFSQKHFQQKSMACLAISTQVHNRGVQRTLVREGFVLEGASITVHVNLLLHVCLSKAAVTRLLWDGGRHGQAGAVAQAHAQAVLPWCEKNQAGVSRLSMTFLNPLCTGKEYALHAGEPVLWKTLGCFKSVAMVKDPDGRVHALAFADFDRAW